MGGRNLGLRHGLVAFRPGMLGLLLQVAGYRYLFGRAVGAVVPRSPSCNRLRSFGIPVMAFLSIVFLHERLDTLEWLGIAQAIYRHHLADRQRADQRQSSRGRRPGESAQSSIGGLAILAGICRGLDSVCAKNLPSGNCLQRAFGHFREFGDLHNKVLFIELRDNHYGWVIWSIAAILVGTLGGLAVLLWSFRYCRALVVTTIHFVVNQVVVVIGGIVCLGEEFPRDPFLFGPESAG